MFDAELATRMMNKIGKELVAAMSSQDPETVREQLQKALNDHGFLYDILHLGPEWSEELKVLDIARH